MNLQDYGIQHQLLKPQIVLKNACVQKSTTVLRLVVINATIVLKN